MQRNIRLIVQSLLIITTQFACGQYWTTLETTGEMDARKEGAFMACKGKFYLIGGLGIKPVNIFDPATGTWTRGAAPPVEMHHFQAERYGEQIYVMGAMTGTYPDERPLEHIYIYDTSTDQWKKGDPIPEERRRGSCGVVSYRGDLYMICGTQDRYRGLATAWVDRYDPRTGRWKKLHDAPRTRDYFHAGMINGKIYAAGGRNTSLLNGGTGEQAIAEVDVYDIESGRWKTLPESRNLPTKRAGCTTAAIMDHLLVIGGEGPAQKEACNVVEAYDVDSGEWETWGSLQQGRSGTQAFMCVGSVFVASGAAERDGGSALSSIEMLEF
jgi:N-acetylneuraminic acid mutarotase